MELHKEVQQVARQSSQKEHFLRVGERAVERTGWFCCA